MLERLRFITAGESHGPTLTAVLTGLPAGVPIASAELRAEMARRQRGLGASRRMKIESDQVAVTAGVIHGQSTGAPIAISITNQDWPTWQKRATPVMTVPRPGHVDLVAALKYGYSDLRHGLERASARETAARVACGAICKQVLAALGISIGGYVRAIGSQRVDFPDDFDGAPAEILKERSERARGSELAAPNLDFEARLRSEIEVAIANKDSLGGIIELFALGLPIGLGSYDHWERRLDARISAALMSIPAIKGIEFGAGFASASRPGTANHDEIVLGSGDQLSRSSNRAGGLEGGITTGEPLILRIAKKPISTTLTPRKSVDLATGEPAETRYERSDICAVPRALPIAEAMLALVLCDAALEKLGGDSLDEILPRLASLRKSQLSDIQLGSQPWTPHYELGCQDGSD